MDKKGIEAVALSIRSLSMDAIQKANSGHPGLPLGAAEVAAVLYGDVMKHNPANSKWADRDRFVLSAGHGSMLLYSILHKRRRVHTFKHKMLATIYKIFLTARKTTPKHKHQSFTIVTQSLYSSIRKFCPT